MSAFTETALIKKLLELNSSQQSIQTLSLWLIHHRKHHVGIIKTWYKELQKAPQQKKLTFMYLANDVIQNSKKKGPEYGKEYGIILYKVFSHIGEHCDDEKIFASLGRILKIWEERGVYEPDAIKEYTKRMLKNQNDNKNQKIDSKNHKNDNKNQKNDNKLAIEGEKRKIIDTDDDKVVKKKHKTSPSTATSTDNSTKTEIVEVNGKVETHITLSPRIPIGEPPEPDELIKALTDLENSASSDASARERIANFPPEISEISTLSKLEDKEDATKLAKQISEAVQLLNDYNLRLAAEMEHRKKLAVMLKNFHAEQKELLAQAEQRLEEYTKKLTKYKDIQKEIRDHLSNLPDLTQLPDVTGGLAPLPSAGDLFNVH